MMEQGVQNREFRAGRDTSVAEKLSTREDAGQEIRYTVIKCLLTQMTTSSFLHPKNINSMIVVLVIVLGKVLSPEEINTQQ